jgi:TM2 domain-containing membrane protein YozV
LSSFPTHQPNEFLLMQDMTDQQKMMFLSQYNSVKKDATVAVLLAFFLGGLGAHRFYMGQIGLGILYAVFVWTFVPAFIALVECFLMSNSVKIYNAEQANLVAIQIRAAFPRNNA